MLFVIQVGTDQRVMGQCPCGWMNVLLLIQMFRCIVALLIHTDNTFMSSKNVFLVPCTDLECCVFEVRVEDAWNHQ